MEEDKIYYWVEYIDDNNNKHLAPIQKDNDFNYIKDNYNIIRIENMAI